MRFILRLIVSAAVVFGVAYFSHGALVPALQPAQALALAFVLALVNAIIKPIVSLLSLPITIVTLGLFSLVINALMLLLAEAVVGVASPGFLPTLVAALMIAVIVAFSTRVLEGGAAR